MLQELAQKGLACLRQHAGDGSALLHAVMGSNQNDRVSVS